MICNYVYTGKFFKKNINDFADGNFSKSHSEAVDGKTEHFPLMVLMAKTINGQ